MSVAEFARIPVCGNRNSGEFRYTPLQPALEEWDTVTSQPLPVRHRSKDGTTALTYSPDGKLLAVATVVKATGYNLATPDRRTDLGVLLWDETTRQVRHTLELELFHP